MKSQINTLRQLQELVLTRDEHNQTGDGSHLDALNDAIDAIQRRLDPQVAGLYARLYAKSHIVISAMTNNCCAVCGMQVPIAQGQQVRLAQHLVTCSSCGRILFAADEDSVVNTSEAPDRDNPKTGISRFSAEELMVCGLGPVTREQAIERLATTMQEHGFISSAENLTTAALEREGVLSTAIEGALAFPHVRGVEGGGLTMAVGVSREGIDWGGETVHAVFLSAIPVAVSAFYLRLMAGIAKSFAKESALKTLLDAKDPAALWKALQKATRVAVK